MNIWGVSHDIGIIHYFLSGLGPTNFAINIWSLKRAMRACSFWVPTLKGTASILTFRECSPPNDISLGAPPLDPLHGQRTTSKVLFIFLFSMEQATCAQRKLSCLEYEVFVCYIGRHALADMVVDTTLHQWVPFYPCRLSPSGSQTL